MCVPLPLPAEPMVSLPGCAFAAATKSLRLVAYGKPGFTTRMYGASATTDTGSKLFKASYFGSLKNAILIVKPESASNSV